MMRRVIFAGFAIALFIVGGAYLKRESLFLAYKAAQTPDVSLADHRAMLAPHLTFLPPAQGQPPYPSVILAHGCAGMRPAFMNMWAEVFKKAGYMAVIVDSHTPRGIDREEALRTVCEGRQLIGQERAGDILAAYEIVKSHKDAAPNKIILAGWSHGALTIMDLLTMNMQAARPAQFKANAAPPPDPAGMILFYPYCSLGARSRFADWITDAPALAFVGGKDTIVNSEDCLTVFESLERRGETIDLHYYPNAEHVFDDPTLQQQRLKWYNEEYAADATEKVSAFLEALR